GDCGGVGGIVVHVVAVRNLARASMAATVDTDHAIAMVDEEQHLGIPVVGAERPAMMEDNRLAVAPVLVKNLDAILGRDCTHGFASFGPFVKVEVLPRQTAICASGVSNQTPL